jgi:glutathione peroxidase
MRLPVLLALSLLPLTTACSFMTTDKVERDESVAQDSFYALEAPTLEGETRSLSEYQGQVTLVVNTASQCGYTKQYAGLQELQEAYAGQGFTVLGFPSGDFGGQEFDTPGEIREFCDSRFGVTFPLFAKSGVKEGEGQSPVYGFLGKATGSLPGWNFGKYLVGRDGKVLGFYASPVDPMGEELRAAIDGALAAQG